MEPWVFDNFKYFDEIRRLESPNRKPATLRPKLSNLLLLFLRNSGKPLRYESIQREVWPESTTITVRHVHGLKDELDEALGDTTLIETIPGVGYMFLAHVTHAEPDRKAASKNGLGPKMLPIFPGIGTPAGSLFVHSAADAGKNDHVEYIKRKVKWEARPRQMVLTSEDAPETMVIPFRHVLKEGSEDQSWWAAVLAVKVNIVTGDWEGTDVTAYNKLVFEARSIPTTFSAKERTMPLLIRLEDNDKDADGGSSRQSTNWHPQEILLPEAFITVELQLQKFNWSGDAWYWNTKAVDRTDVAQIVFGHDSRIPSLEGTIEIRNVRFEI
jgi:DNA-binding winged helix-turn-helix (wHTH) protein